MRKAADKGLTARKLFAENDRFAVRKLFVRTIARRPPSATLMLAMRRQRKRLHQGYRKPVRKAPQANSRYRRGKPTQYTGEEQFNKSEISVVAYC